MVQLYLPTFIFDVVHQSSQHLFFDYFLKALALSVKKTLQALCFVVVVKLKKQYKMIASVVSCQLVRDWTASRDAILRTFLSAFCLALLPTESKTATRLGGALFDVSKYLSYFLLQMNCSPYVYVSTK